MIFSDTSAHPSAAVHRVLGRYRGRTGEDVRRVAREMLLDDSRRFADRMQLFESSADLQVWRGQIHVFQAMFRVLPEARAARRSAGEFLSRSTKTC